MDTSHALVQPVPPSAARTWRRLAFAAALAAGCLASAAAPAQEDPPGRVGRVADIAGNVRTLDAEGGWMDVVRNQVLSTGDRITTDKSGRATLQIGSTVVRLGADTDLVVTQMDDQHVRLRFDHGQLAVRVRSDDIPGELFIDTDEGAWVPHHPGQYRFDRLPRQALGAQAWSGDMLLEAPDSSLPLKAPQRAQVWRDAKNTTHYHVDPAVKDAFGDWVLAQDKQDDVHAAANAAAQVSPEMTGESDLARFGTWSAGPGGERVWTPAKLPAGWQPYQQGAWSWKLPWGWTWVDDQPWGFAPFHYGRWLQLKGRWSWSPGQWGGARPVFAPALVGWIGGPALNVDGGPAIGWVALAPDEPVFPGYAVSARYWNAITEPSVAPAARRPVAISGRARLVPVGGVTYANRAFVGAVTVVGASALGPWVPVSQMPGPRGADLRKPAFEKALAAATPTAPPGPPSGRGALSASSPTLQVPLGAGRVGQVVRPASR